LHCTPGIETDSPTDQLTDETPQRDRQTTEQISPQTDS
jgi:hypothetical protein